MTHRHLNDEQLSAHLDGERPEGLTGAPEDALETDIAACDTCRQRLARLAGARALVRTPVVPVAPSLRAAAVETAIADGLGAGPPVGVVPLASRRPRRFLNAVAAAVAVLAVVAGVSVALAHARSSSTPSASSTATGAQGHRAARTSAGAPTVASPSGGVVSLGSVSSPPALRRRLAPVLASPGLQQQNLSATTATGATQNSAGVLPSNGFTTSKSAQGTPTSCAATALRAAGTDDTQVLEATATYRGTPALVVVAQGAETSSTASVGRVAVVVARSGCRVLARTAL